MIKEIKYLIEQTINFNPVDYDEDNEIIISDQDISNVVYKYRPTTYIELKTIVNNLLEKGIKDLNCIDVSAITDFSYLFAYREIKYGKNIGFKNTILLDELDISEWNVSNGISFSNMFYKQSELTKCNISNWNVSNSVDLSYMFFGCYKLKEDISNWDLSKVKNLTDIVIGAHNIKHNIPYRVDGSDGYLAYFPTTKDELRIILMKMHFHGDRNFNMIDVSKIIDFSGLFTGPDFADTHYIGIENWDVSNGVIFSHMFRDRMTFNADLSKWNVSNGVLFNGMFHNCTDFESDLSNWDVSNGVFFHEMFTFCESLNTDLSKWNVKSGKQFKGMFSNCRLLNCDLSHWDVSNADDTSYMFVNCYKLNTDLSNWDLSKVPNKDSMFIDAPYIKQPSIM